MPRAWYIKAIDPEGKLPFVVVKPEVVRRCYQYYDLVVKRTTEGECTLLDALNMYQSFYFLQLHWVIFSFGCHGGCKWCCKWTICEHTAMLTSVFDAMV